MCCSTHTRHRRARTRTPTAVAPFRVPPKRRNGRSSHPSVWRWSSSRHARGPLGVCGCGAAWVRAQVHPSHRVSARARFSFDFYKCFKKTCVVLFAIASCIRANRVRFQVITYIFNTTLNNTPSVFKSTAKQLEYHERLMCVHMFVCV